MKGPERPCSIKPQLRSSRNVLQRSVEPATQGGHSKRRPCSVRDVLRDRNDLKLLTRRTYYISNGFAHQQPCHWGYVGIEPALGSASSSLRYDISARAYRVASKGDGAPKATVSIVKLDCLSCHANGISDDIYQAYRCDQSISSESAIGAKRLLAAWPP
jgi:hypothetical protein